MENMSESKAIMTETLTCKIWGDCVYGAGCVLSKFESDNKKMPLIVLIDGIPHCYSHKKG